MREAVRRMLHAQAVWLWLALAAPLVLALVVLAGHRFYPLLDLAMTELRVRDVGGSDTPVIGLPGRIGQLPEQGSHPGPLSFWLLAPTYRLAGASAYALEVGTVVIHLAAAGVALWTGKRVAGEAGLVVTAVMLALLMRGYGTLLLVQPWNPYLPLIAWLVVLLSVWAVLAGHDRWLVVVAVAGTFAAQTHVPYLLMGAGMFAVAAAAVVWRLVHVHRSDRRDLLVTLGLATAAAGVLWAAPIGEQLVGDGEGNISRLLDHFGSPGEDTVGFGQAVSMLFRHLNVIEGFATTASNDLMHAGGESAARWPGVVLFALWAGAVVVAYRAGANRWNALNVTIAAAVGLGLVDMSRIFGEPWYYLTLWMWAVTLLMALSVVGSVLLVVRWQRPHAHRTLERVLPLAGTLVVVASSVAFTIEAADAEHPDERASDVLGAVVGPTYDAIVHGVGAADGPDGRYVVRFQDSNLFGSQYFGLVNELERRGLDVGGDPGWRVPLLGRVVANDEATAEIRLASGVFINEWRRRPGTVEVASADLRTDEELARYRELRRQLIAELRRIGADDLVELADTNVFGLSYNPDVSERAVEIASEMLEIGTRVSVFIVPIER